MATSPTAATLDHALLAEAAARAHIDTACYICTEPYDLADRRPKLLPCGHDLCATCAVGVNGECPLDRTTFLTGDAGVAALPDKHETVAALMEQTGASHEAGLLLCGCGLHAVARCAECEGDLLCGTCLATHNRLSLTKRHQATPLAPPPTWATRPMCPKHEGQERLLSCTRCLVSFCPICFPTGAHSEHPKEVVEAKDAATTLPAATVADALQHAADMAAAGQTIAAECDAVDVQKAAVTSSIAEACATIHAAVDARFNALSLEAAKLFHDKSKQLSIQGDTLTVIKHGLESAARQVQFLQDKGAHVLAIDAHVLLASDVARVTAQNLSLVPCTAADVTFHVDPTVLLHAVGNIGRVWSSGTSAVKSMLTSDNAGAALVNHVCTLTIVAHNSDGVRCTTGGNDFAVAAVCGNVCDAVAVCDRGDGTYALTFTPSMEGEFSVTAKYRGQPVQGSPLRIAVVARLFQYANGTTSQILDAALERSLAPMFPGGFVPREFIQLIAADGGISVTNLKPTLRNVPHATLYLIRTTTNFVFGCVLFDPAHVLSDATSGAKWLAGHADNFLFNLAGHREGVGPIKLLKNAGALQGVIVGCSTQGLTVGAGCDLVTFHGAGMTTNYCVPGSWTTVAPGYAPAAVSNTTLAGAQTWVPQRSEVYALVF